MGKIINKKVNEFEHKEEIKVFSKEQFVSSKMFRDDKDIVNVVMNDNEQISKNELNKRIENFKKGKVK